MEMGEKGVSPNQSGEESASPSCELERISMHHKGGGGNQKGKINRQPKKATKTGPRGVTAKPSF